MITAGEGFNEDGYWSGDNGASGVVPVCPATKRLMLTWRSSEVNAGDCYGVAGGACKDDISAMESAKLELAEETGYDGPIRMIPAYTFVDGSFRYRNFIGVVPSEFEFDPEPDHAWENDFTEWMTLDQAMEGVKERPHDFHHGLVEFLKNEEGRLRELLGGKTAGTPTPLSPPTEYQEQTNGWAAFPDARAGERVEEPVEKMILARFLRKKP